VLYNPLLCTLFDAHINLEVVSSVQAVKYIYKYIYKGPDRILAALRCNGERVDGGRAVDEISQYQHAR
jgi:hypothetical protein